MLMFLINTDTNVWYLRRISLLLSNLSSLMNFSLIKYYKLTDLNNRSNTGVTGFHS